MNQITFSVPDIHCPSCSQVIKMSLEELPGIEAVNVDLAAKIVVVAYDPKIITIDQIAQLIQDAGYHPSPLA